MMLRLLNPLVDGLLRNGFDPVHVREGRRALESMSGIDLVLLDLGLPDLDAAEVCRRIRENYSIPIIMLSARSEEVDRVMLLETGADDYVVKPFGLRELTARIRAVARRSGGTELAAQLLQVGPLVVDLRAHSVSVDGVQIDLTPKEFDLLAYLAADPGAAHTRRDILEEVWDSNWYGSSKTLDVHVASLRRKLGHPEWILAVRGVGFKLVTSENPGTSDAGLGTSSTPKTGANEG